MVAGVGALAARSYWTAKLAKDAKDAKEFN
jgi:hypothetical protein